MGWVSIREDAEDRRIECVPVQYSLARTQRRVGTDLASHARDCIPPQEAVRGIPRHGGQPRRPMLRLRFEVWLVERTSSERLAQCYTRNKAVRSANCYSNQIPRGARLLIVDVYEKRVVGERHPAVRRGYAKGPARCRTQVVHYPVQPLTKRAEKRLAKLRMRKPGK